MFCNVLIIWVIRVGGVSVCVVLCISINFGFVVLDSIVSVRFMVLV